MISYGKYSLALIILLMPLYSCTYSINMVHTQGTASDVVDEDQKADPVISPNLNVPLKPT
jgi:hypothetical protein